MVRVISVHHFTNQSIQTVEQPTACTVAPPNKLLLALTNNCIEVRDLKNNSEILFNFPSVDEVIQIVHCRNGDYVATLETKFNRQNKEINFVRVYINWDSVAALQQSKMTNSGISLGSSECGMVQPMRARIAGRVTPTTNQTELSNLEMIEIPVKHNPNFIDCCQLSGNLFILSKKLINIYTFRVRLHDISKLKFIDFDEMPIYIELKFIPNYLQVCENYIACMNHDNMYLFKLLITITNNNNNNNSNLSDENNFNFKLNSIQDESIDYKQLIKDEYIDDKITVNLPSIVRDNSVIHKNSPFTFCDKDMIAIIHSNTNLEIKLSQNYIIKNLIQLKLKPILIENAQRQITEEFKCMVLKPIYIDENLNKLKIKSNKNINENNILLKNDYSKCLNSIVCMIATQQEGYLYYFNEIEETWSLNGDNCITVYPFTAPVYKLVMEDYFLHALTETGLESYTLRFGHQLCKNLENIDNINVACPSINDSVCLVGLRPFLGIEQIHLNDNNLILLANADNSPTHSISSNTSSNTSLWTLYNLELPTSKTIFNDISIVANMHRFTSTQTYCHLMNEAHIILRLNLLIQKWSKIDENVKLIIPIKLNNDDIVDTYRTSCALLADHYIMCQNEQDFILAYPYYKMARITPMDVLNRIKKIQEFTNITNNKGLLNYSKRILFEMKSSIEIDKYFINGCNKQNFIEHLLNLLEIYNYKDLPNLILKSKMLREYSIDKLINILNNKLSVDQFSIQLQAERNLSLTLLYIQKSQTIKAETCLNNIIIKNEENNLNELLLENWELLFDITTQNVQMKLKTHTTFSELSILLINGKCCEILIKVLINLIIEKKLLTLNKLIKIFLEYLPSSISDNDNCNTSSLFLQKTLELYFQQYFNKFDETKCIYERGMNEAMKLLVRSYLSQLQIIQLKEDINESKTNNLNFNKIEKELLGEEEEEEENDEGKILGYNHHINKIIFEECDNKKLMKNEKILFFKYRYNYLDKMPPFLIEITSKLYKTCLDNYSTCLIENEKNNKESDLILMKLQALLSSPIITKQIINEVNVFLTLNNNLRANISLQSILLNVNDAILLLIDQCPQCLLQFGKDRFNRTDEWKFLIATVQRRILRLSQNEKFKRICFFHKKILKDILTYVATSMNLDQLFQVFPQRFSTGIINLVGDYSNNQVINNDDDDDNDDNILKNNFDNDLDILNEIQNYEPYIILCKETMHANQINKLITTTGQQLLCTLNL